MTDYAAAPIQPIVQGLITFSPLTFTGKGVSGIARGANSTGDYVLTLDAGLPGNAGALQATPDTGGSPAYPDARTLITVRGSGSPPVTTVTQQAVAYTSTTVEIVLTVAGSAAADPTAGVEVVVWKGVES